MIEFWQNIPKMINPIAVDVGFLVIRWYSLMYLNAICVAAYFISKDLKKSYHFDNDLLLSLFNYCVIGVILGSRLGYVVFYNLAYYLANPLEIFWPFSNGVFTGISGLSYHGGGIGFLIALGVFAKKKNLNYFSFLNKIFLWVPLAYTFGRIGNFLNLELWGRKTNNVLGMYFPTDPSNSLRIPSQLIEAFGEGIFLFFILYLLSRHRKFNRLLTPTYIIGYGIVRFLIEFVREPDSFQILVFGVFSYGQILSFAMIILGVASIQLFFKNAD